MGKKEYTVNEIFENQILNELYEIRSDGLECLYIKMYGKPEILNKTEQSVQELVDFINKIVKDEQKQKEIWLKLDEVQDCMHREMIFWEKQFYKFGFLDRIYLKKEIVETKNTLLKNNTKNIQSDFFYKYICAIKESLGDDIWKNRKDYKEIAHKMSKIKTENPKLMAFIEGNEIVELTKEETKALSEYLKLADDIRDIELVETFKLGLQEENF